MGTPGGSARIPGRAERRSGSAPGVAGRAARAAGSPGWLARAQPLAPARPAAWLRPSAAANCISPPPPAAPVRNVGRRRPLGGRAGLVLVLRPDVSAPRSAPGVCGTRGCGPRRPWAGKRRPGCWQEGVGVLKVRTGSVRTGGHQGRRRSAGAPGWTRALWGPRKMRWRLRRANVNRGSSGRKRGALCTCRYVPAVATECSGCLLAHSWCSGSTWGHFQ